MWVSNNRTELWDRLDNNQLDLAVLYMPDHNSTVKNMKQYMAKQISEFPNNELNTMVTFTASYQLIKFAEQTDCNTYVSKSFYKAHKAEITLSPVKTKSETNFESCFIYRKNKSEIPRLVNFLKEWDKFIKEKDYDSRLEDIKVNI